MFDQSLHELCYGAELWSDVSLELVRHGWGSRCLETFLNELEYQSLRHEKAYHEKWTQMSNSWPHSTLKCLLKPSMNHKEGAMSVKYYTYHTPHA